MNEENEQPRIIRLEETTSTNNYLRGLVGKEPLPEGSIVVTEYQTAGRGQVGNTWESEPGKNLMFSVILYPDFLPANRQFLISQIAALSVKETLDAYVDGITVKWPNDIYWNEKKICGILIENDLSGHHIGRSISGIGVNINQDVFRSNAPNPISLKQITGKDHDRYLILANIMKRVKEYYTLLQADTSNNAADIITERYVRSLFRRNGFHRYADADGEFLACLLRVEPDGRFILKDQTGKERGYLFKEVQYLL